MEAEVSAEVPAQLVDVSDNGVTLNAMLVLNGDVEDTKTLTPIVPKPKVLEMNGTTESIADGTSQTYTSKLEEHSVLYEEGVVVTEKRYEESAIRRKSVKTDESEVATTSHIMMKANKTLHTTDEGIGASGNNIDLSLLEKHSKILQCEGNTGALIDLGALGEIKLGSTISDEVSKAEGDDIKLCHGLDEIDMSSVTSSDMSTAEDGSVQEQTDISTNEAAVEGTVPEIHVGVALTETTLPENGNHILENIKSETKAESKSFNEEKYTDISNVSTNIYNSNAAAPTLTNGHFEKVELTNKDINQNETAIPKAVNIDVTRLEASPAIGIADSNGASVLQNTLEHAAFEPQRLEKTNASQAMSTTGVTTDELSHVSWQSQPHVAGVEGGSGVSRHAQLSAPVPGSGLLGDGYSSARSHHYRGTMEAEAETRHAEASSPMQHRFAPNDRKTADDLVKRILEESRQEKSGKRTSESTSQRVRIDMGGGMEAPQGVPAPPCSSSPSPSASSHVASETSSAQEMHSESRTGSRSESASGYKSAFLTEAEHTLSEKAVGAERKREPAEGQAEQPSLFERRLGDKLEHIFTGDDATEPGSGRALYTAEEYHEESSRRTTKRSEGRPGERTQNGDFDELDQEINAIRQQFKDTQARRYVVDTSSDAGSDAGSDSMAAYSGGYRGRTRMRRQEYVDEGYAGPYGCYRDSPESGREEEEYIPDEEFEPQRREETTTIVQEKTTGIRTMVDQQSDVLKKLRRASESFDELQDEIKAIRQQFIESNARRDTLLDEDFDIPDVPAPRAAYVPGSYVSNRHAGDLAIGGFVADGEVNHTPVRMGIARKTYGGYNDEDETTYTAAREYRSKFGRSRSLYDSDEMNSYRSSASQFEAGEDGVTGYTKPSYSGYGGSSYRAPADYNSSRLSYTSRFSRTSGTSGDSSSSTGYKPRYTRSFTLPDIESAYSKMPSSGSTFTSRFLQKVRDDKVGGGVGPLDEPKDSKPRDKPFKSRFLKKSFDSDFTGGSSSKYSGRFSSSSKTSTTSSVVSTNSASADSEKSDGQTNGSKEE